MMYQASISWPIFFVSLVFFIFIECILYSCVGVECSLYEASCVVDMLPKFVSNMNLSTSFRVDLLLKFSLSSRPGVVC